MMTKKEQIINEYKKDTSQRYVDVFHKLKDKIENLTYAYVKRILYEYTNNTKKNKQYQGSEQTKNANQGDTTKPSINLIKRKKKELFLSDIHIPYHDEKALSAALNYALDENITTIVLCGDISDFKSVSFWERNADERDLNAEVEFIRAVLNEIREAFPNANIYYIEGNHEERLRRFINSKIPELSGLSELAVPNLLHLNELNIKYISNKEYIKQHGQPFQIGKLFHIHGHEVRASWGAVNVARNVFLKTQRNIIMGHSHTTQEWVQRSIDGEIHGAWAVGCLSELVAPYMPINNWNHGFAIVEYEDNGDFTVYNRKIINGKVV